MKNYLDRELLRKLVTFGVVGVLTALSYVALTELFRHFLDLSLVWAGTLAYPLAIVVSYIGQGAFTFRVGLRNQRQFARFVVTNIIGYCTAMAILSTVPGAFNVDELVALVLVVVILPLINFLVYLVWVFASRPHEG